MSRGYDNGANSGIALKHGAPASMGFKDDLYALLHVGDELKDWLEDNFFLQVDNEAAVAMRELANGNTNLEIPLRNAWARFIMAMMARTPDRIEYLRQAYDREVPKLRQELSTAYDLEMMDKDPPPTDAEKAAAIERAFSLGTGRLIQSAMELPNVGTQILQMHWLVIVLPDGGRDFLTSDYPVHLSKGLQYEDALFALPISPRKIFFASNSRTELDRLLMLSPADLTQAANKTVVQQARQYVYGKSNFERNFVAKYLGQS
jgi:hypothetical protein